MDRRVSTEERRKGTGPTARRLSGSGSVWIRTGSGAARVSIQASDGLDGGEMVLGGEGVEMR
jgi:hypothetical protein